MICLTDGEVERLTKALAAISLEAQKPIQRKNRVYNLTNKAVLIIKKAKRRQIGRLNLF